MYWCGLLTTGTIGDPMIVPQKSTEVFVIEQIQATLLTYSTQNSCQRSLHSRSHRRYYSNRQNPLASCEESEYPT